jgi:SNF2 family DNA or RNA helicase
MSYHFTGELYPFQQDVLEWTEDLASGIIGLDMGLGKTVATMAMMCQKAFKRTLIVLPLPILQQWRSSLLRFTTLEEKDIGVYQGRKRKSMRLKPFKVVLTTYECIRYDMSNKDSVLYKNKRSFDGMVLDEAHKIRNKKTATFKSCHEIGQYIAHKWLLTGTPIQNKIADFMSLCTFLDVVDVVNKHMVPELKNKYYYRLTKAQSGLQLPEKSITDDLLNFDEAHSDEYSMMLSETKELYEKYIAHPSRQEYGAVIVKILRMRQCCNHMDAHLNPEQYKVRKNRHDKASSAKFDKTIQLIKQAGNEKTLVFSQWTHSLDVLSRHLHKNGISYLQYDGSLDIAGKNELLEEFRDGPINVMLITLTSGGIGLDMSYANHVILMDSWWNQALEDQAIDRVYRIGQMKRVDVHRLYMANTIEHWMIEMKREKHTVDTQFHDGGDIYEPDKGLLKKLLHRFLYPQIDIEENEEEPLGEEEDESAGPSSK